MGEVNFSILEETSGERGEGGESVDDDEDDEMALLLYEDEKFDLSFESLKALSVSLPSHTTLTESQLSELSIETSDEENEKVGENEK